MGEMSIGMIIWNSKGEPMAATEKYRRTSFLVERAEAQALVDGVQLALKSGISSI